MFVGLRAGGVAPTIALTCQMTDSMTKRGPRANELVDRKACIRHSSFSNLRQGLDYSGLMNFCTDRIGLHLRGTVLASNLVIEIEVGVRGAGDQSCSATGR
jgi:hypothetical protein